MWMTALGQLATFREWRSDVRFVGIKPPSEIEQLWSQMIDAMLQVSLVSQSFAIFDGDRNAAL